MVVDWWKTCAVYALVSERFETAQLHAWMQIQCCVFYRVSNRLMHKLAAKVLCVAIGMHLAVPLADCTDLLRESPSA